MKFISETWSLYITRSNQLCSNASRSCFNEDFPVVLLEVINLHCVEYLNSRNRRYLKWFWGSFSLECIYGSAAFSGPFWRVISYHVVRGEFELVNNRRTYHAQVSTGPRTWNCFTDRIRLCECLFFTSINWDIRAGDFDRSFRSNFTRFVCLFSDLFSSCLFVGEKLVKTDFLRSNVITPYWDKMAPLFKDSFSVSFFVSLVVQGLVSRSDGYTRFGARSSGCNEKGFRYLWWCAHHMPPFAVRPSCVCRAVV